MSDDQKKASALEVIDTLKSIDRSLKLLVAHFGIGATAPTATSGGTIPAIAPDSDLDGKYGNPVVKAKDPKDWTGESQLGKPFSECPPEYLDLVAARLDWFAQKADEEGQTTSAGKPVAPYNRRDAARARGWAKRLRAGWKPETMTEAEADAVTADDIAFTWFLPFALAVLSAGVMFA